MTTFKGIAAPLGFKASGINCGIKKSKKDLALIYSCQRALACGFFTTNRLKAAPLILTKEHLKDGRAQAILVNSGCANSLTGKEGLKDSLEIVAALADLLNVSPKDVLMASTGVIGTRLPVDTIKKFLPSLVGHLSRPGAKDAASAIMTTDTFPKQTQISFKIDKRTVTIGAMAKGAGMIHPELATMLAFLTTDARIESKALRSAFKNAINESFNLITVDGDTSTNDSVLMLANGLAKNQTIRQKSKEFDVFLEALKFVCKKLAEMVVLDAEGATKFVKVKVSGASGLGQAKKAAYKIANSSLVKTSLYGALPNWGRIAACLGSCGVKVDVEKLEISINSIRVFAKGKPQYFDVKALRQQLRRKRIGISVDLNMGGQEIEVLTSDLSPEYVKINASYT
jgi:glutamate N-acetyltransferase/amino-acid N-acetyltransferase